MLVLPNRPEGHRQRTGWHRELETRRQSRGFLPLTGIISTALPAKGDPESGDIPPVYRWMI